MVNEIVTDEQRKRIKEFQSLYYALNARPDTITKLFFNKVILEMSDILTLEDMIKEKLALHYQEGQFGKTSVTVTTNKHKVYEFDDIELFRVHNWNSSESIEGIVLTWDFYIVISGYENPQRHKLTVKLSSGLRPEEVINLIFSGKLEDVQSIEAQQATIVAQMDFIDNLLGQEFLNIVENWVNLLQAHSEKNKFILLLKRFRKYVAYYMNYLLFFLTLATLLIGFNMMMRQLEVAVISEFTIQQFNNCVNYIVISAIICYIILHIGRNAANKVFRRLVEYGEDFIFNITKEDQNRYKKTQQQETKSVVVVFVHLAFSIILNVTCGVIASIMFSKL
mgnify:CR=1 FL=1